METANAKHGIMKYHGEITLYPFAIKKGSSMSHEVAGKGTG